MSKESINRLQGLQLDIMLEVKRICEAHNLRYFLVGGSLLGAIRHGGFIPWDDDLDIAMPRKDYDAFISICTTELDSQYYLHTTETDSLYWLPFAKVRKNGTYLEEESITPITTHKGIYIDIFPLDVAVKPGGPILYFQKQMVKILAAVVMVKRGLQLRKPKGLAKRIIVCLAAPFSISFLIKCQRKIMTLHNKKNTEYWVNLGSNYNYIKQTIPVSKYCPPRVTDFEGEKLQIPNEYEYILTRIYGDYMRLPPEEKRVARHAVEMHFGDEPVENQNK